MQQQTQSGKSTPMMGGDLEMQHLVNANSNIPLGKVNETMDATRLLDNSSMSVAPVEEKPAAGKKQVVAKKAAPVAKGKKAAAENDSGSEEDSSEEEAKALNKKKGNARDDDDDSDASTVRSRA